MKIYLAGPMRGYEHFNFPAFHAAAKALRDEGYDVFSPAEKGEELMMTDDPSLQEQLAFRRKVFSIDMDYIANQADTVALLPGWEKSAGARAERALAEAIGLNIMILGTEFINAHN
jgi:nucleoside 2-deoxyribosyltransferase